MNKNEGEVVIFPKWKRKLEEQGLKALKEKRYKDALSYFEELSEFGEASYEVMTGKVICHMELGEYETAKDICRLLMKEDVDNYYKYLHIYLTILFQRSEYQDLIDLLDEVFQTSDIPHEIRQQFWQLYELSEKFNKEQREEDEEHFSKLFLRSLNKDQFPEQWKALSQVRKSNAIPYIDEIKPFLVKEEINPLIKTGILQWFQEQKISTPVLVGKFNHETEISPDSLQDILEHPISNLIMKELEKVEQNNPSLFNFIQQMLYRYLYVYYPFMPKENEIRELSQAFLELGLQYLQIDEPDLIEEREINRQKIEQYKREIEQFELSYFSQLNE